MIDKDGIRRTLMAVSWSLAGSFLVFALLILMNKYIEKPNPLEGRKKTEFKVAKPPAPKLTRKRPPPQRKKRVTRSSPRPPRPVVSGAISGVSFGLPQFETAGLADLDDAILGDFNKAVMTEDLVDTPPRPKNRGGVEYPRRARAKGVTGFVALSLLIDPDGSVERVKILDSTPVGFFEEAAIKAVKEWRFSPAQYEGNPVKVWAKQTIKFELKG